MEDWIIWAGLLGGIVGGLAVLFAVILGPQPKCAGCGEPPPKFRKPANRRQMLWGGWTCAKGVTEPDRRGRKVNG